MRVGVLGSGLMGGKLGTILARSGHEVVFSYSRSNERLEKLAREAQAKARCGTPHQAAQEADVLLLAVHWSRIHDVLNLAGVLSESSVQAKSGAYQFKEDPQWPHGRQMNCARSLRRMTCTSHRSVRTI